MKIEIFNEIEALINALAKLIVIISKEAIAKNGQFNFVLSGGSSPRKLYELLASDKFKDKIEWQKTYFFFGDERFVPAENSQRNSLMANESLFEPLKIPNSNIFALDTTKSPEESAKIYAKTIENHFNGNEIKFDFVLLGLGDNSHTASLFPFTSVLNTTESTVKSVYVEEVNAYRITMTAPLINQAENIAFLVFGDNKSEAVHHILAEKNNEVEKYPAKLIAPKDGKLFWFLDENAAALLKPKS